MASSSRRLVVVAAVVVVLLGFASRLAPVFLRAVGQVRSLGAVAPAAYLAIYVVAVVALVPASWLTLAGGAIFGIVRGLMLSFLGAVLGSTAAFLLGRFAFRGIVARQLERMPRLAAIDRTVSAEGRRVVFLLRLSPLVPFNLLNYALGLTTLSTGDFLLASVGMLPATFLYAYCGRLAGEALALAGAADVPKGASYYVILAVGLAATVAATIAVTKAGRRALRDV